MMLLISYIIGYEYGMEKEKNDSVKTMIWTALTCKFHCNNSTLKNNNDFNCVVKAIDNITLPEGCYETQKLLGKMLYEDEEWGYK